MAASRGPHPHPDRRKPPVVKVKGFTAATDKTDGMKRIVISFDVETFESVKVYAASNRWSFAEAVRNLVEWGLDV